MSETMAEREKNIQKDDPRTSDGPAWGTLPSLLLKAGLHPAQDILPEIVDELPLLATADET